jgi:hypothetical protein
MGYVKLGEKIFRDGLSSCPQILSLRVRFPMLPEILRSSGSGTGPTQPTEDNRGAV